MGIKKDKPKSERAAAKSVSTKDSRSKPQQDETSTYIKESEVQRMSAQEYEKHSDEIMEAIRSGKFVYDVSGSAR
jgi:anti-sigma28 factor (negative regulator of flagellin synthesis)